MRFTGAILILTACLFGGCCAADRLKCRAGLIQTLMQLNNALMTELESRLPFIAELLPALAERPAFRCLKFLREAAQHAEQFPESWDKAVRDDKALPEEARAVLTTIGQTLGSTTLEGQLSALRLCEQRLTALYTESAEYARQKGTLCRSLGLLGGMFLVILLI